MKGEKKTRGFLLSENYYQHFPHCFEADVFGNAVTLSPLIHLSLGGLIIHPSLFPFFPSFLSCSSLFTYISPSSWNVARLSVWKKKKKKFASEIGSQPPWIVFSFCSSPTCQDMSDHSSYFIGFNNHTSDFCLWVSSCSEIRVAFNGVLCIISNNKLCVKL